MSQLKLLQIVTVLFLTSILTTNIFASNSTNDNQSGAFIDGNVVTLFYNNNYACNPSITQVYANISSIANVTGCGEIIPQSAIGTLPIWVLIPSFAGMSNYGYSQYNSTSDGFPTYNGTVIETDCGAGNTSTSCSFTPTYFFTPYLGYSESIYGIYNGIKGLPEGLLPMPAHSFLLLNDYGGSSITWYTIFVRVYDPNIFPNASTGQCKQIAPSNLSNPTGNCLTSFNALRRASNTKNSYIPSINQNNPFWYSETNTSNQIRIVLFSNISGVSSVVYPNSNLYLSLSVNHSSIYTQRIVNQQTITNAQNSYLWVEGLGALVVVVIIINLWWFRKKQMQDVKTSKKR